MLLVYSIRVLYQKRCKTTGVHFQLLLHHCIRGGIRLGGPCSFACCSQTITGWGVWGQGAFPSFGVEEVGLRLVWALRFAQDIYGGGKLFWAKFSEAFLGKILGEIVEAQRDSCWGLATRILRGGFSSVGLWWWSWTPSALCIFSLHHPLARAWGWWNAL